MAKDISITAIITRNALVQSVIEVYSEMSYAPSITKRVLGDLASGQINTIIGFKREFILAISDEALARICAAVPAAKAFAEKHGASEFLLKFLKSLLRADGGEMSDGDFVRLQDMMLSVAKYIRADQSVSETIKNIIDDASGGNPIADVPEVVQMDINRIKLINGLLASYRPGENDSQMYNAIYRMTHFGTSTTGELCEAIDACFTTEEQRMIIHTASGVFGTVAPEKFYTLPAAALRLLVNGARADDATERSFAAVPEHWLSNVAMYLGTESGMLTKLIDDATGEPEILTPQWRRLSPQQKAAVLHTFSQHGLLGLMGFKYMLDNAVLWAGGVVERRVAELCLQAASGNQKITLSSAAVRAPGTTAIQGDPNLQVQFDQWLFWHLVALRWNPVTDGNPPLLHFGNSITEMIDCIENEALRSTLQLYYSHDDRSSLLGGHFKF